MVCTTEHRASQFNTVRFTNGDKERNGVRDFTLYLVSIEVLIVRKPSHVEVDTSRGRLLARIGRIPVVRRNRYPSHAAVIQPFNSHESEFERLRSSIDMIRYNIPVLNSFYIHLDHVYHIYIANNNEYWT